MPSAQEHCSLDRFVALIEAQEWNRACTAAESLRRSRMPQIAQALLLGSEAAHGHGVEHPAWQLAKEALSAWRAGDGQGVLGRIRLHYAIVAAEVGESGLALSQVDQFLLGVGGGYPELSRHAGKAYRLRGDLLKRHRQPERAIDSYRQAAECFRRDGQVSLLSDVLHDLAWVCCERERAQDAGTALRESANLAKAPLQEVHQILGEAHLALVERGYDDVRTRCVMVTGLAEHGQVIPAVELAKASWLLARTALAQGQINEAERRIKEAMRYAEEAYDPATINAAAAVWRQIAEARSGETPVDNLAQ